MITELCIDVIDRFKELRSALDVASETICHRDRDLPAWFQPPPQLPLSANSSLREQACTMLRQLEYLDAQQPREILVGAGIIAASVQTIEALEALNCAKYNFKQSILKLKAAKLNNPNALLVEQFEQLLPPRDAAVASNLSRMGLARIHLKQCYRKIPHFMQRPDKIAWTWANTRSIIKINVQQAEQLLSKQVRDVGIERQLKLLQGLDPNEPLAIVQDLAPHLRANLVFPDGYGSKRLMVKGPVPIFYLDKTGGQELPEFTPPGAKRGRDKERVVRKDVKINPEPFLPAIRAYRYFAIEELETN